MKQIVHISSVVFASMMMLAVSFLPHHHHDNGMACFLTGQHEEKCSEQHTNHNPVQNIPTEHSNCGVYPDFIVEEADQDIASKAFLTKHPYFGKFQIDLFVFFNSDLSIYSFNKLQFYGAVPFFASTLKRSAPPALRAPPF